MRVLSLIAFGTLLSRGIGCPFQHGTSGPAPAASEVHGAPSASASGEAHGASKEDHRPAKRSEPKQPYKLPFVREPGSEDPMDRARSFLRELVADNAGFMRQHDAKYFKPFVDAQRPRATIVTCSDSRVQSPAFDGTPDNDLFTIRNIGNQIATAEGSVEYGVEHLKTPVLLILGHTGCGAVKAALGDFSSQPAPIRSELETIDLTPMTPTSKGGGGEKQEKGERGSEKKEGEGEAERPRPKRAAEKPKVIDNAVWLDGVITNVHRQVALALDLFEEQVGAHELVVVGAVYDFRNDLRQGFGSVSVVNVNGYTENAKLLAFVRALDEGGGKPEATGGGRLSAPILVGPSSSGGGSGFPAGLGIGSGGPPGRPQGESQGAGRPGR